MYLQDPPRLPDLRHSNYKLPISVNSSSKRERYPPTPISHLPGTGPYALDSFRIFCSSLDDLSPEEWKSVIPTDKELIRYLVCIFIHVTIPYYSTDSYKKWKWAFVARKEWIPGIGVIRPVSVAYLKDLISDLKRDG